MLPRLYTVFYGGDARERLVTARRLFRLYGAELLADTRIAGAVAELRSLQETLLRQMLAMEMDRTCSRCAGVNGSGCCNADFAEETDVSQLLLNMLAGIVVAAHPNPGIGCCFLGERGCSFAFKPMFCLNYNCSIIVNGNRREDLRILEQRTGSLLRKQHDAENLLIAFFKDKNFGIPEAIFANR